MACHFRREETIMEEKQTVKYILLTIENRTVRVAIGMSATQRSGRKMLKSSVPTKARENTGRGTIPA